MTQGQFLSRVYQVWYSEFSFSKTTCLTKAEEPSMFYYLPIAGGRIIWFIPFPKVLLLCEMQSVSSRIWTRVAVSIFYDDNHYPTGTSLYNPLNNILMVLESLIDQLILMTRQTIRGYFMSESLEELCTIWFMCCFFRYFLHTVIWYQVFLSNTNNLQIDQFDPQDGR